MVEVEYCFVWRVRTVVEEGINVELEYCFVWTDRTTKYTERNSQDNTSHTLNRMRNKSKQRCFKNGDSRAVWDSPEDS